MKKGVIVLSVIFITIACNQNIDSENAVQTENIENVDTITEKMNFSAIGFELMETETVGDLKTGMTIKEVEKIMGKPDDVTDFEYWEADGFEHQMRIYQDSTIDMDFVRLEDGKVVTNMITVFGNSELKTSRGVGIGSTAEEVEKVYENEISTVDEHSIIVGTIYGGIIFKLKDGKVVSIFIGSAAE